VELRFRGYTSEKEVERVKKTAADKTTEASLGRIQTGRSAGKKGQGIFGPLWAAKKEKRKCGRKKV